MQKVSKISLSTYEAIEEFFQELSLTGSQLTAEAYVHDVQKFVDYLHERGIKKVSALGERALIAYLDYAKRVHRYAASSINRKFMAIRAFSKFLYRRKYIKEEFTRDLKAPTFQQSIVNVPSEEDVKKILDLPDVEEERGVRDRALLELLYSSGLRATEICMLKRNDVTKNSVTIFWGKGRKTRTVPLTKSAIFWVEKYVQEYRGDGDGNLFLTLQGKTLNRNELTKMVTKYGELAGVKISAHSMRHAFATHMLERGADIRAIQELLGHKNISTTQRYTHLSSKSLNDSFNKFHPMEN